MYSYEERLRAVKLYIKLGKREAGHHPRVGVSNEERPERMA